MHNSDDGAERKVSKPAASTKRTTNGKKPEVPTFVPSTKPEEQAARKRYHVNVEAALRLVEAGAAVLPLQGKTPRAPSYQRLDADMTPERLAEALENWRADQPGRDDSVPDYGFGATRSPERINGWPSIDLELAFGISLGPSGVQVVDCDDEGGAAFLAFCAAEGEPIDFTVTPCTLSPGRGGLHLYFANPTGRSGRKVAALSLDLKAYGGQVVAPGMILPPKLNEKGEVITGERAYLPMEHSLDLCTALREGRLPPLPACFVRYLIANPPSKGGSANKNDAIREAADLLEGGPAGDRPERDVAEMVERLREESPAFDTLWREGDPDNDRSAGRMSLANRMVGAYGSRDFDAWDLREAYLLWEHAGEPRDRDVAREHGKAVVGGNVGATDGSALVNVEAVTLDQAEVDKAHEAVRMAEVMGGPDDVLAARSALADVLRGGGADDTARAVEAVDVKTSTGLRALDKLMARCRAGEAVEPEGDGPLPAAQQAKKRGLVFETSRDLRLADPTPARFLVKGLIEAATLFTLIGDPGAGKSALMLDMLLRVAYGLPWAGRKTEKTGVIYLCSEGPSGLKRRHDAWHRAMSEAGLDLEDAPLEICRTSVDLFGDTKHLEQIEARVRTFAQRHGIACGLVIIDTMRQAIPGADESSARDIGLFTAKLNGLRDRTGVTAGFVHHTGKNAERGASGSTAITGNVDTAIAAKWDKAIPTSRGAARGPMARKWKVARRTMSAPAAMTASRGR